MIEFEDLSSRAASVPQSDSPFDSAPELEPVFDGIVRSLHRGARCHVVLVGERGVGLTTLLAEFARRMVQGRFPGWKDRKVLRTSCRYVSPSDGYDYLLQLLDLSDRHQLIVGLEGFGTLLQSFAASSSKSTFLAMIARQ